MSKEERSRVRVRYAETDCMGVLHHGIWLHYWEVGRSDYMRARGRSYAALEAEEGFLLPVIDCGVQLLQPAHYDEEIEIRTRLTELGRVKLRFDYEGWGREELLARGHTIHAVVDRNWRVRRLPEAVTRCLVREET